MIKMRKLELAGPAVVVAAIACAQVGALALAIWPNSPALWYLNLKVFRFFDYSLEGLAVLKPDITGQMAQALWVAVPLLALACIGAFVRVRLALALATNFSLLYSVLLLHAAYATSNPVMDLGFKLSGLFVPSCCLAGAILLLSTASSAVSHRAYWREIFS